MLFAFPATCHLQLPMSFLSPASTSSSLVQSALVALPPFKSASSLALAAVATSTMLQASKIQNTSDMDASSSTSANKMSESGSRQRRDDAGKLMFSPRASACIYMACAMALHFGGYEFARSGALALFTSSTTGYAHPAAYPFGKCNLPKRRNPF
jgi:hypothetical protein